jgi:hypothetical protein
LETHTLEATKDGYVSEEQEWPIGPELAGSRQLVVFRLEQIEKRPQYRQMSATGPKPSPGGGHVLRQPSVLHEPPSELSGNVLSEPRAAGQVLHEPRRPAVEPKAPHPPEERPADQMGSPRVAKKEKTPTKKAKDHEQEDSPPAARRGGLSGGLLKDVVRLSIPKEKKAKRDEARDGLLEDVLAGAAGDFGPDQGLKPERKDDESDKAEAEAFDLRESINIEGTFGAPVTSPPAPSGAAAAIPPISSPAISEEKEYFRVRVYFATDRNRKENVDKYEFGLPTKAQKWFGNMRSPDGALSLGMCVVAVPKTHRMGEMERPKVFKLEFTESPAKHVVVLSVSTMREAYFLESVDMMSRKAPNQDALVFIHGYNVTFAEAVRRTAQIAFGVPRK